MTEREHLKRICKKARESAIRPTRDKEGKLQYCNDIDGAIVDDLLEALKRN